MNTVGIWLPWFENGPLAACAFNQRSDFPAAIRLAFTHTMAHWENILLAVRIKHVTDLKLS